MGLAFDLLLSPPEIQERVLDLEAVDGVDRVVERAIRGLVRHESWPARGPPGPSSASLDGCLVLIGSNRISLAVEDLDRP